MRESILEKLLEKGACSSARRWLSIFPTMQAAWDACEKHEHYWWMVWILYRSTPRLYVEKSAQLRASNRRCRCKSCDGVIDCCRTLRRYFPNPPRIPSKWKEVSHVTWNNKIAHSASSAI